MPLEPVDDSYRPAFRRLDLHQVDDGPQRGLVLVDPLGLTQSQAFVPEGLLPVLSLFDGQRTVADVQREVERQEPTARAGFVLGLVRQLDEHLLLLSPRFHAALHAAARRFAAQEARPASHAGSAGYPAHANQLRAALRSMVRPHAAAQRPSPRGLIAPHIDLARGREGYAMAYGWLAECEPADLYVICGTGHQGPSAPLVGLTLDWETPLGRVRTDKDFVGAVHRRIGAPEPLDVWLHHREHSVEFQVLFLQHVLGERPFAVAGFLTGNVQSLDDPEVQQALAAVRAEAETSGRRICFIGGADLAHVGPHFGDAAAVDSERLARLAASDREHLTHLERGDAAGFHRSVEGPGNPDRICGTAPIWLTASLAGGAGQVLHYGQAKAADGSQVVTYCSVAYGE